MQCSGVGKPFTVPLPLCSKRLESSPISNQCKPSHVHDTSKRDGRRFVKYLPYHQWGSKQKHSRPGLHCRKLSPSLETG
ncbi:unnamed protein product [Brassica rapa subsp. trilocularis]